MKKKILILGSEGQIGSHLVEFFKKNEKYKILKFDLVLGRKFDIRNFNNSLLEKNIKKSDFIFFLAFDVDLIGLLAFPLLPLALEMPVENTKRGKRKNTTSNH